MSESEAVAAAQRMGSLLVRSAEPADHEAIGGVVLGAYARHAGQLVPEVFSRYLDDELDLGTHASYGRLLVAATPERVLGFAAFYPDASVQDSGFPSGWAGVRVLAVHPGADGPGVARALLGACERLAARSRGAGARDPHGQLHDRCHRRLRAARLPPGPEFDGHRPGQVGRPPALRGPDVYEPGPLIASDTRL